MNNDYKRNDLISQKNDSYGLNVTEREKIEQRKNYYKNHLQEQREKHKILARVYRAKNREKIKEYNSLRYQWRKSWGDTAPHGNTLVEGNLLKIHGDIFN
eukprot:SAG11_NODE_4730_length_1788_cov_14.219065_5_plen_100_part_00